MGPARRFLSCATRTFSDRHFDADAMSRGGHPALVAP